jgi:glyoxylase-like metal-dependent hydrolase (beta-lactamase superfamily II)
LKMINISNEKKQLVLDQLATSRVDRRKLLSTVGAAAVISMFGPSLDQALAASANQEERQASPRTHYDFIVVGAGAAGSVLAAELSASGAQVLVIESGGPDDAPTIANPSVWFYNVGGPLDYHLPVTPALRLNNRKFNMALGHVLGGGTSINAMVWTRGMQRDFDGWAKNGAKGWAFADVLPIYKRQEDWEGGADTWRGAGGPVHIRRPGDPHPTAPAFDHLVIFEPPLFEGRSEGVISAAKKSAPGKPIRHIVLSHFHDDHMGGVRTYAAEGAIVVVHSSAGDYIRAVLGQRRTLEPDRLEIARRDGRQSQPAVMHVDDAIALTDGAREVKLYHVPNNHSSGMLVGYVPDARVLFTADLVSDTFPLIPVFASTVHELIQENGLSVEMIACGHGNVMPYAQLAYALGK